ncbi:MAG TPA: O-antigen ligase family protein [Planctomycetota bacterium]|nr:O-antigen ligase family protein [Planctomycetota bacterium]
MMDDTGYVRNTRPLEARPGWWRIPGASSHASHRGLSVAHIPAAGRWRKLPAACLMTADAQDATRLNWMRVNGILLVAAWPLATMSLSILAWSIGSWLAEPALLVGLFSTTPFIIYRAHRARLPWQALGVASTDWRFWGLFAAWIAGALLSVSMVDAVMYTALTAAVFVIAGAYTAVTTPGELRLGLGLFGAAGTLILFAVALLNRGASRELVNNSLNPNAFGFFAMACGSFAFCLRPTALRAAIIACAVFCIMAVSSRASLLGLAVTVAFQVLARQTLRSAVQRALILAAVLAAVFLLFEQAGDIIRSVLALDDPRRGIGSGFTGRTAVWAEVWELFEKNPVLGVGFRCHQIASGEDANNGYLAYIAETGILGGVAGLLLIGTALVRSWRRRRDDLVHGVLLSAAVGYLAHSVFERFIFNAGNPGSLLFILWIVYSITDRRRRGVPEFGRGAQNIDWL